MSLSISTGAANGDDGESSWSSPKRRPRPTSVNVHVGRNSGAVLAQGSFGKAERFASKIKVGHGVHSPTGPAFYGRSQLWKMPHEVGKHSTQGYGERKPTEIICTTSVVGPGSYKLVKSAAGTRSALDGSEYCTTTMKPRLPSMLTASTMCSPGPHAKYEVRKKADHAYPTYNVERLSHGSRTHISQDNDGPGPGAYDQSSRTIAASTSSPNLRGHKSVAADSTEIIRMGGTKKNVQSTFGMSSRFSDKNTTCSPDKGLYYAHNKSTQDYATARSCTLGRGSKTDFSNLHNLSSASRIGAEPATYYTEISQAKPNSFLDPSIQRCASPIFSACREIASRKQKSFSPKAVRRKPAQQGSSSPRKGRSFDAGSGKEGAGPSSEGAAGGGGSGEGAAAAAAEGSA